MNKLIKNRLIEIWFVFDYILEYLPSNEGADSTTDESDAAAGATFADHGIQKINFQPSISRRNANRFALQFHRETVKELKAMKEAARKPIEFILRSDFEIGCEYFDGYDFPIRPKWSYDMSKEQLDRNENRYFTVIFFLQYAIVHRAILIRFIFLGICYEIRENAC